MTKDTTVIFDLGNVVLFFDHGIICRRLANLYDLNEEFVYQKIFEEGIERKFDEGKLSPENFTEKCSKALNVQLQISEFKKIWSDMFSENHPVIDIVKGVRKKSRVFLLSNTNIWHIEHVRKQFRVLELFDQLILSFQVGYVKPDRRIFERTMKLCADSKLVVYVDDVEGHVRAAKDIGFYGIQYREADLLRSILASKELL